MSEKGIDVGGQQPKSVGEYLGRLPMRHLIIVCDGANEKCPAHFSLGSQSHVLAIRRSGGIRRYANRHAKNSVL